MAAHAWLGMQTDHGQAEHQKTHTTFLTDTNTERQTQTAKQRKTHAEKGRQTQKVGHRKAGR